MLFTQYNPVLFLTTIAITTFVLFTVLYISRELSVRLACAFMAALAVIGLIKYHQATKPAHLTDLPLFLNLTELLLVAFVAVYFTRLRWSHRADLFLLILTGQRRFFSLPLLTKCVVCLAAYTAVANFIAMFFTPWMKLDILVYASLFWFIAIQYLSPLPGKGNNSVAPEPIDREIIEACLSGLKIAFEVKKMHLDPELTLQSLSQKMNVPSRTISMVLNREVQKNFHEYLNQYRVEEAKKLLLDYRQKNTTIAAVAYEAGFNSIATFQRVFKKISGLTPREFAGK
ncbi:helix-turn-helix domain-containing protein [Spirosoma linguale]|uniref:Transcriptional regulator, AraC family n=1 Tax=Spirosoma linguale (strain ATCC 33905 / DSM 74 / LMG 10896 / Claus 1) TaxID=504472 RepID=D2QEH3_SPILD|nr:transcriptional regulator, AraC family [Spirosoma linguale DSM 74]